MKTSTIVLAGVPEPARIDFSEKSLLPREAIRAALASNATPDRASTNGFKAQWRQLPESLRMRPILPKLDVEARPKDNIDKSAAEFVSASDILSQETVTSNAQSSIDSLVSEVSSEEASTQLSDFYDHSFSIHAAVPTSELSEASDITPETPMYESTEMVFPDSSSSTGIIRSPSQRRLSQFPRPKNLSDLDDIPNANYLHSIEPQTMTVHLIVAVLSIGQPRTVITGAKYGKPRETDLVDLLVGDDTKSGFCVTMWLPREMHVNWKDGAKATPEGTRSLLRRSLKIVRPRDVILLQNVALSSFKGKVHGQSLRKDVTKLDLLFRKKIDIDDFGGIYSAQSLRNATDSDQQLLKVKKVRDWMLAFVGEPEERRQRGRSGRRSVDGRMLPPDTQ